MSIAVNQYFDVFDYVKRSKELGVKEDVAEYQARQIEHAVVTIANEVKAEIKQELHSDDLATKKDIRALEVATKKDIKTLEFSIKDIELKIEQIRAEIYKSKYEIVIWIAGLFVASGLIQHFLRYKLLC